MKHTQKLFLYSLTSLAVGTSSMAFAEELVTAPTLEGGVTASIGTFYVTPSSDGQDYGVLTDFGLSFENAEVLEVNPDYEFGFEASLGYIFEDTANGIELSYRNIDTSDDASTTTGDDQTVYVPVFEREYVGGSSTLSYDLNAADLMISQFVDVGTHAQMRFLAGASYLNLEKKQTNSYFGTDLTGSEHTHSDYSGWGPKVAIDARYDFGSGFGVLAGGSLAYYLGDLDLTTNLNDNGTAFSSTDDVDNHAVTNLRANVGIDYVYFYDNEDRSTVGIELGYLVDYYADAIQTLEYTDHTYMSPTTSSTQSLTFSGPYLNLKGAF